MEALGPGALPLFKELKCYKNANLLGSLFELYIFILNSAIGNEVLAIFQKVKPLPWT